MTYYVVAETGHNYLEWLNKKFDYMSENYMMWIKIYYLYYLLIFLIKNLISSNISGSFNLLKICENNNILYIQSAGNKDNNKIKKTSETKCQISKIKEDVKFNQWLAGIIDGDGNFDIRNVNKKKVLKAIRIKLHNRDIRILNRIRDKLHLGRIKEVNNKPYSLYIISTKEEMSYFLNLINGFIRLKYKSFKLSCDLLNIPFKEPEYLLNKNDPYFSGLIDTDGSIVLNHASNRIECNLEVKYTEYSKKLNLDNVIENYKPKIYLREKTNQTPGAKFKSIAFKYQTAGNMINLYNYFMVNRLYSDFKFYRVSKIKKFLEIRHYNKAIKGSKEYHIYTTFLFDWIQYSNPLWLKVLWVKKYIS